jgi:hypothetical protein
MEFILGFLVGLISGTLLVSLYFHDHRNSIFYLLHKMQDEIKLLKTKIELSVSSKN